MPQTLGPGLAMGRTAEVYAWREGQVLKPSRSWCREDAARHEAEIVRAVTAQGYPAPRWHPDQVIMGRSGPVVIDWTTARQGLADADVARTLVVLTVGNVPDAGPAMRAFIAVWRRLVRRVHFSRYRALSPELRPEEIARWVVPAAAARMPEGIPGEERRLRATVLAGLRRGRGRE